jgi:hypothetical protein
VGRKEAKENYRINCLKRGCQKLYQLGAGILRAKPALRGGWVWSCRVAVFIFEIGVSVHSRLGDSQYREDDEEAVGHEGNSVASQRLAGDFEN